MLVLVITSVFSTEIELFTAMESGFALISVIKIHRHYAFKMFKHPTKLFSKWTSVELNCMVVILLDCGIGNEISI